MSQAIPKNLVEKILEAKNDSDIRAIKISLNPQNSKGILTNASLLEKIKNIVTKPEDLKIIKDKLKKRRIRTQSGIAAVAVLVKPFPCPGKCAYCPKEKAVPQSYLKNEPAVMRALRLKYNPYDQVFYRLQALENNGHDPKKIELIIIGANFSSIPKKYRLWYVANCFKAANDYPRQKTEVKIKDNLEKKLLEEQKKNEKTSYRLIGLTVETRPDWIKEKEVLFLRQLGCTRVELGAQTLSDKILEKNLRGHGIKETIEATKLLKDYGFKITYHFMPGLPGSSPAKDFFFYKKMFTDSRFQPDQIKFYPTTVVKGSLLYTWWKKGTYQPYTARQLKNLIIKCKKITPDYVRIVRLIRDIPAESIEAGNLVTNLRQELQKEGVKCRCIRCREIGENVEVKKSQITIYKYLASEGEEYFVAVESLDKKFFLAFGRLRICAENKISPAIIRELHVYGQLVSWGGKKKTQHAGWGKKIVLEMEKIAKKKKLGEIAVISGVGVRDYYRHLGYKEKGTYLVKKLK